MLGSMTRPLSRKVPLAELHCHLGGAVTANGSIGAAGHPEWLALNLAAGGLTVNGGASVNGAVTAPAGTVMVNGTVVGSVAADRMTVNGGGRLRENP